MEKINNNSNEFKFDFDEFSKEENESLVLLYLNDYYTTLDEYYLTEALQIAKDEKIDIQQMMQKARKNLN